MVIDAQIVKNKMNKPTQNIKRWLINADTIK